MENQQTDCIKHVNSLCYSIDKLQLDFFNKLDLMIQTGQDSQISSESNSISSQVNENKNVLKRDLDFKIAKQIILDYLYICHIQSNEVELTPAQIRILIGLFERIYPFFALIKPQFKDDKFESEILSEFNKMMLELSYILNIIMYDSLRLCNLFIEQGGLGIIFKYLTNRFLIDSYVSQSQENTDICLTMRYLMDSVVCLARAYGQFKKEWKDCMAVQSLLFYLNATKDIADNKLSVCMALAYVADDDDIDKLSELKQILPEIVSLVGQASKIIKENRNLKRVDVDLNDSQDDQEVVQVCCVIHMGAEWSLVNLLKALYHLAVSDKLKYEIYYKNHMKKYLKVLILHGNEIEKEYTLKLLWQLCFDKQIGLDIIGDSDLFEYIGSLATTLGRKGLVKCVNGILWQLDKTKSELKLPPVVEIKKGVEFSVENTNSKIENEPKSNIANNLNVAEINGKHIMISYNKDSRELCLRVKEELQSLGWKVWIDVESISGSSLESMANAIENSLCVLICMTEKYKLSVNCRAEAEYAFQLNKPIIPLIMQKDYKADGWLGIILGSKIFVHFMKYDFEECIRRLKAEIDALQNANKMKVEIIQMLASETKTNNVGKVKKEEQRRTDGERGGEGEREGRGIKNLTWSVSDVNKWLSDKLINPGIVRLVNQCDGKLMHELYLIKQESPDFFFRTLFSSKQAVKNVTLKDIAQFNAELKELFSN